MSENTHPEKEHMICAIRRDLVNIHILLHHSRASKESYYINKCMQYKSYKLSLIITRNYLKIDICNFL